MDAIRGGFLEEETPALGLEARTGEFACGKEGGGEGLARQRNTECARPRAGQQGLWDDPWWPSVRHLGGQVKATNWMWT